MDKVSYALGLSMGNNFRGTGIRSLNVAEFADALKTVLEGGEPKMSYEEAKEVINQYFAKLQQELQEANLAAGEAFLAENAKKEGVVTLPSGLQYQILTEGTGAKPTATDRVRCHYQGALIDGHIFDSSKERGEAAVFGVNQVIPGWVEALQLMPVGSTWKLFIPANLGYGEHGAGEAIPGNSTLVFEVELLEIL